MAANNVSCAACGRLLPDEAAVTPEFSCPDCGGVPKVVSAAGIGAVPTPFMLDNFVAHKLSSLKACGATVLAAPGDRLNTFILTSVVTTAISQDVRAYLFNYIHRSDAAIAAYGRGRTALEEYFTTPATTVSPYFRALVEFETCVAQTYQGLMLLRKLLKQDFYRTGDGSVAERLGNLHTTFKHMEDKLGAGHLPDTATMPVWITDTGLETSTDQLQFIELTTQLRQLDRMAAMLATLQIPKFGTTAE
jgi:hypothetical protein